ncbi:MAG: hypothetical protein ACYC1Z_05975 [Georgenia sp.]
MPPKVLELTVTGDAFELWGSPKFPTVELIGEHFQRHAFAEICTSHGMESGGEIVLDALVVPHRTNPYDPYAVSVHVDGLQVGFLEHDAAESYHPVLLRLLDHGRIGVTRARIEAGHDDGIWSARVTIALGEPDTIAPANLEPAHGVELPIGRSLRVAGVHRHHDVLQRFLEQELPGAVFLTLVPGHVVVPGRPPPVKVLLDDRPVGQLTADMSREYTPLLERIGAAGAVAVVRGRIGAGLSEAEVSIQVARATAIPEAWLTAQLTAVEPAKNGAGVSLVMG